MRTVRNRSARRRALALVATLGALAVLPLVPACANCSEEASSSPPPSPPPLTSSVPLPAARLPTHIHRTLPGLLRLQEASDLATADAGEGDGS